MDPKMLLPPENPIGYPTPFWFIELFKVLGFSLHVVSMNLWYAGTLVAAVFGVFGRGDARMVGFHIARALPIALAFGINFGVIPLLFIQVAYYQFFYPATILMAWPWFAVFWMVMIAYYAAYLYRLSTYNKFSPKLGGIAAWVGAGIFLVVGFLFANAMSLMARPEGWWEIFNHANAGGAATGVALNLGDATLVPRWLFMFGIAITTTAAYVMVDAAYLSDGETEGYRKYAAKFSAMLYTVGLLWFVGFGSWYIFGTEMEMARKALANPVMKIVFPLTAVSPGLVWLLIMLQRKEPKRRLAALAGAAQFGVIALNAVSRQWVQNMHIAPYADLGAKKVDPQNSALIVFLLLFVGGLALIVWMLGKVVQANRAAALGVRGDNSASRSHSRS